MFGINPLTELCLLLVIYIHADLPNRFVEPSQLFHVFEKYYCTLSCGGVKPKVIAGEVCGIEPHLKPFTSIILARAIGIEPIFLVLETSVLPN